MSPLSAFPKKRLALAIGHVLLGPAAFGATINVNNSNDTGFGCTLRDAVEIINAQSDLANQCIVVGDLGVNDTITFGDFNNVSGLAEEILIESDVSINPGGKVITVSGTGGSRLFQIISSNVTMENMIVTGGSTEAGGGGLYVQGSTVTLINMTISDNASAFFGAGILAKASEINLSNTTVSNNSSGSNGGGVGSNGGGIAAVYSSNITLNNSIVSDNSANFEGGGIWVFSDSSVALTNSTVSNNYAGEDGGGVVVFFNSSGELNNSTVSNNSAVDDAGGIHDTSSSSLVLTNSTVSANSAGNKGGGVYTGFESELVSFNSTVSGNTANVGGGIFVTAGVVFDDIFSSANIINSTIYGNTAPVLAGGLYSDTNSNGFQVTNSIVAGNTGPGDGQEIFSLGGFASLGNNFLGHSGISTFGAFAGFVPTDSDIVATATGNTPTALAFILSPLASNRGPTQTHALVEGSPAIDAGNQLTCEFYPILATDQRGQARSDGQCDIGSFEFVEAEATIEFQP